VERDFLGALRSEGSTLSVGNARVVAAHVSPELARSESGRAARAVLRGGAFVVGWSRKGAATERCALIQEFDASGAPRGGPVVISPPAVDVMRGTVSLTTDGSRVLATFLAVSNDSLDRIEVPIELRVEGARDRLAVR
jgi:hypothetical protein